MLRFSGVSSQRRTGACTACLRGALLVVLALPALAPERACAQRDFDVQLFLPPAAGGSTFTVDRPSVPGT
ncbi:MAG: hypothetical protein M5U28_17320 [Sandaracinaceae bacterium]|nr:hypothetical protein [Sandaracinaceae bacterium]